MVRLEWLPTTVIFAFVALLIIASCEAGFRIGRHKRSDDDHDAPTSVGPLVGGLLGMLAFVLAFTFSMVASQHDQRKQNLLEEANAIGTAYLRADLISTPRGTEIKALLREYVDDRLQAVRTGEVDPLLARVSDMHRQLWALASAEAVENPNTNTALMIQSINAVIDVHEKRLTGALRNRIPGIVWTALLAITVLTMATLGIQLGLTGKRRLIAIVPLSMAFAVLVTLVVDLNRPQSGLIVIGQDAMITLQKSMQGS